MAAPTQPVADPSPPPPAPSAPVTEPAEPTAEQKKIATLEAALREQHNTILRVSADLEAANKRKDPPPPTADDESKQFYKDPVTVLRREIEKAVAPLVEFKNSFDKRSKYDQLKARFQHDPRYRDIFPRIESTVDQMMVNLEANEQNIQAAILTAIGMVTTGIIPGGLPTPAPTAPAPSQPTGAASVNTPPHLRPSSPPPPGPAAKPKRRELNENERRLARERGLTPDEYLDWLEEEPEKVAFSKIGKEDKK